MSSRTTPAIASICLDERLTKLALRGGFA